MPLFFNNYDTPGPGVSKDEKQKPGIIRYFVIIGRHFWDLGILNFMYFFTSIPAIAAYFFVACLTLPDFSEEISEASFYTAAYLGIMLPAFLGNGPVRMGICYVLRNYSAEKHAFMWSDLRDYAKKYFLRGTVFFLINIVFLFLICMDIRFYFAMASSGAFIGMVSVYLAIFLFLIYIVFNSYFHMISVTFDMGIKETIKSALVLTLGKFFQNFACLIVCAVFAGVLLWVMGTWPVTMFLLLLLGYTYIMLLLDMNSFSVVKKYMAKDEGEEASEDD